MVTERIIVLTKTYPEVSGKYGYLVCVAGVNEYGEWRRLYPIPLKIWMDERYKEIRFKKWDIIEVNVGNEPPPHDRRFESRRISDWKRIRVVRHIGNWGVRLNIIKSILDRDIKHIMKSGRSLGVIKPHLVKDFFSKPRQRLRDEGEKIVLDKIDENATLLDYIEGGDEYLLPEVREPGIKVEKLPWIGYKFHCNPMCKGHEMMVIDWEAQELFRKYKMVDGPVKKKLFYEMIRERDPYFIIGNTWRYYRSFMVIGLFYPPKGTKPIKPLEPLFKKRPRLKTLDDITGE